MLKSVAIAVLVIAAAQNCGGGNVALPESGTYSGVFTVTYGEETHTGPVTLELSETTYKCSSNPDRIPAGGEGSYEVEDGIIRFSDGNFRTADFDWNLVLNGTYSFTYDGENLELTADRSGTGTYRYELKKE